MNKSCRSLALAVSVMFVACQPAEDANAGSPEAAAPAAAPGSPEAKIAQALSAAPSAISEGAAVMDWPSTEGGQMTELRAGSNGWTCMPDAPNSPGPDPMCLDAVFSEWAAAWSAKRPPSLSGVGFAYMLQGGSDASNTDPFATDPGDGEWVETGPHVMMVVPDPAALATVSDDYRSGAPYVMWRGTPYAHVMMPVR